MSTEITLEEVLKKLGQNGTEGISAQTITTVMATVAAEYTRLSSQLNRDNAWRLRKLRDAADDALFVSGFEAKYGTDHILVSLLELMVFSADLGRLIIIVGQNAGKDMPDQVDHGRLSADFITEHLTSPELQNPLWRAVLEAITRHSYKENPDKKTQDSDPTTYWMTCLLRDLDMYGGWRTGDTYLTPEIMSREIATWGLTNELYIPRAAIDAFLDGRPLDRNTVETYAGFMLQFLAWGYNVTIPEIWNRAIASGNPAKVLRFVLDQLMEGDHYPTAREIKNQARIALNINLE